MDDKKNKKIVIVDDEESIAGMYSERLSSEGYETIIATDGEQGLKMILVEKPDFILLDIMLPKMSGIEILEIIRKTPGIEATPIIVLSAYSNRNFIDVVEDLGSHGFFNKAATMPQEIASIINQTLFPIE